MHPHAEGESQVQKIRSTRMNQAGKEKRHNRWRERVRERERNKERERVRKEGEQIIKKKRETSLILYFNPVLLPSGTRLEKFSVVQPI